MADDYYTQPFYKDFRKQNKAQMLMLRSLDNTFDELVVVNT